MSRSNLGVRASLRSSVSLALAAAMVVGAGAAETPKSTAAATGSLPVATDPENADAYVDGRLAGQTPATLAALSAGAHRVRIVKSGYLENARIVRLTTGEPLHLNVKLTKTTGASNETAAGQVTSTGGGGGGAIPGCGSRRQVVVRPRWSWLYRRTRRRSLAPSRDQARCSRQPMRVSVRREQATQTAIPLALHGPSATAERRQARLQHSQ